MYLALNISYIIVIYISNVKCNFNFNKCKVLELNCANVKVN